MKAAFFSMCVVVAFGLLGGSEARAFGPGGAAGSFGYPFVPFGFYQPYGATYGTSLRTPPYFALNPPVYYGTRYARPYGLSPFAAPPVLSAPADYEGQPSARFVRPPVTNPYLSAPCASGCADAGSPESSIVTAGYVQQKVTVGEVKRNPFVEQEL